MSSWCSSRKRGFASKQRAKEEAKRARRTGVGRQTPYLCKCGWWHLTRGGLTMAVCRSCSAPMRWCKMPSGRMNPLDVEPVPLETKGCVAFHRDTESGVVVSDIDRQDESLLGRWAAEGRTFHLSHFATCEFRKEHRKS